MSTLSLVKNSTFNVYWEIGDDPQGVLVCYRFFALEYIYIYIFLRIRNFYFYSMSCSYTFKIMVKEGKESNQRELFAIKENWRNRGWMR